MVSLVAHKLDVARRGIGWVGIAFASRLTHNSPMPKSIRSAKSTRAKSRRVQRTTGQTTGEINAHNYVLKAARGNFVYRGLPIKMTFGSDARSKELEEAMRESVQNTHALTD